MKLVLAGGGTGGHLFPALALAEEFRRRDPGSEITFIGASGGIEERVVPGHGYPLRLLNVEGIKRTRGLKRITAVLKAACSTFTALSILREIRPEGVIGSGSYSSAPVVLAAKMLGIRTAVLEQNALPGLTNRALGRFVDRVYLAFPEARKFFPLSKALLAGNPVRKEIIDKAGEERERKDERFTILVFGGSQGAVAVNAAFVDSTEYLADIWPHLRVIHQTGKEGFEQVFSSYRRKKMKVEVHEFIEDMASVYAAADLAVCRAGATSIAELTAFALPSVLIPYPFAADNHQELNARSLAEKGAAVMIRQDRLTGRTLAEEIRRLFEDRGALGRMREKARALARPNAAGEIAESFLNILGRRKGLRPGKRGLQAAG